MPNTSAALGNIVESSGSLATAAYAKINVAASATATSVVAAVTGKKIRVIAVSMVAGGTATNVTFNTATTALSPLYALGINGVVVLPYNPAGWFETVAGDALTVTTGTGATTGISVTYAAV
jgi:hypothetical protein